MTVTAAPLPASPAELLASARAERRAAEAAEARLLALAVEWAGMHSVDSLDSAATVWDRDFGETAVPVAGPGAPLVGEFAVAELAAALGMSTDSGRLYLGQAVELAHRLPRLWARVQAGDLPGWRARRIAEATTVLPAAGASFVDAHLAPVAHQVGNRALDRLVDEAKVRFAPDAADADRRAAADRRHVEVDVDRVSFDGTVHLAGELDLADALDLDDALAAGAAALARLGCPEPVEVRRALALGELARRQPALELDAASDGPNDDGPSEQEPLGSQRRAGGGGPVRRRVVLYAHLSADALGPAAGRSAGSSAGAAVGQVARVENTGTLLSADQVRAWCGVPGTHVIVRPVLDLAAHLATDGYRVPDDLAEQARLVHRGCVFPWCTHPARARGSRRDGHPDTCDTDHVHDHRDGGPTCSCNVAPLCRRHHRVKTTGGWSYEILHTDTVIWTSRLGRRYLRDPDGTLDVTSSVTPDTGPERRSRVGERRRLARLACGRTAVDTGRPGHGTAGPPPDS